MVKPYIVLGIFFNNNLNLYGYLFLSVYDYKLVIYIYYLVYLLPLQILKLIEYENKFYLISFYNLSPVIGSSIN